MFHWWRSKLMISCSRKETTSNIPSFWSWHVICAKQPIHEIGWWKSTCSWRLSTPPSPSFEQQNVLLMTYPIFPLFINCFCTLRTIWWIFIKFICTIITVKIMPIFETPTAVLNFFGLPWVGSTQASFWVQKQKQKKKKKTKKKKK